VSVRTGRVLRFSVTARDNVRPAPWRPRGDDAGGLAAFERKLKGAGDLAAREVVLAGGEPLTLPDLDDYVRLAAGRGATSLTVATNGLLLAIPERALRLRQAGATAVEIQLVSPFAEACERLTGVKKAHEAAVAGVRRALAAGLAVDLVVPLLAPGITDPERTVALAQRLTQDGAAVRALRFEVPREALASDLAPAPFDVLGPALARALRAAADLGLATPLLDRAGVPFCALADSPDLQGAFQFDPRRVVKPDEGFVKGEVCAGCAHAPSCRGVTASYAAIHGERGLRAFTARAPGLSGDRVGSERRPWDDAARDHARESRLKILRLTLACNQRCVFCPTDGTSETIVTDPRERLRTLRRWADAGVTWVSFSGGEPTLVKELPALLRAAAALGIGDRELVTNGVRLADPAYFDQLLEAGLNRLFVSLHAHQPELSDALTGRAGDFEGTVACLRLAVERGLRPTVNHVICAPNHRELPDFVDFLSTLTGNRASLTLAFITPLYLAGQRPELIPRLSDVAPSLHAALDRAEATGLDVVVLSRPGIPPCFLGPRRLHFSDLPKHVHRIASEDLHKKEKGPQCARCMYDTVCAGLWKGYTALHGTDELVPIEL
jgi:molybdenum cofactor biosynthesis enzyme MoaA